MFENIGGKLKTLAQVVCWIGIIASVIGAIALWMANSRYNPTTALGFGVLIGGCLVSWLGSFFTYALGEIVEGIQQQTTMLVRLSEEQRKTNELLQKILDKPVSAPTSNAPEVVKSASSYLPEL